MHEMVFAVRDEMQVAYPELKETAERVSKVVLAEEEQFARVIAWSGTETMLEQKLLVEFECSDSIVDISRMDRYGIRVLGDKSIRRRGR